MIFFRTVAAVWSCLFFSLYFILFFLISELERKTAVAGYLLYGRKVELKAAQEKRKKEPYDITYLFHELLTGQLSPHTIENNSKNRSCIYVAFLRRHFPRWKVQKMEEKNILIVFIIIFICSRGNLLAWWLERLLAGWERALRRVGPSLKISLVFDGSKKKRGNGRQQLPSCATSCRRSEGILGGTRNSRGLDTKKTYFQLYVGNRI